MDTTSTVIRKLSQLNITPKRNWVDATLSAAVLQQFKLDPCSLVYDQLLNSDLKDIVDRSADPTTGTSVAIRPNHDGTLPNDICMQILTIVDCGSSYYTQYKKLEFLCADSESNSNEYVDSGVTGTESRPWEPKDQRCLFLTLTDGFSHCSAFEFQRVQSLHDRLPPGTKILLAKGTLIRKGVVLLGPENVRVLGGCVRSLCIEYLVDKVLAKKINQPFTADTITSRINAAKAQRAPSTDAFARHLPASTEKETSPSAAVVSDDSVQEQVQQHAGSDVGAVGLPGGRPRQPQPMQFDEEMVADDDSAQEVDCPEAESARSSNDELFDFQDEIEETSDNYATTNTNEPDLRISAHWIEEDRDLFDEPDPDQFSESEIKREPLDVIADVIPSCSNRDSVEQGDILQTYAAKPAAASNLSGGVRQRSALSAIDDDKATFWPEARSEQELQPKYEPAVPAARTLRPFRAKFEPDYVYLSNALAPSPGLPPSSYVRKFRAVVTAITERLCNGQGAAWSMKVMLSDGSAAAECSFTNACIEAQIGMSAAAAQNVRVRKEKTAIQRGNEAIQKFMVTLQRLDLKFQIEYEQGGGAGKCPIILAVEKV